MVQLEGVLDAEAGLQLELVWAGQEGVRGEVGGEGGCEVSLGDDAAQQRTQNNARRVQIGNEGEKPCFIR